MRNNRKQNNGKQDVQVETRELVKTYIKRTLQLHEYNLIEKMTNCNFSTKKFKSDLSTGN